MTMFSMKPKFDLAKFLAVPASASVARSVNAKRRGMQVRPRAASEDTVAAATRDETVPDDQDA